MPYRAKLKHLFKIMFQIRDAKAAEGLWFEGTWLNDQGEEVAAREAFEHSKMLDKEFAGAFYNYAALTEKLKGNCKETISAWEDFLAVAENDPRQAKSTITKVRTHVEKLKNNS